MIMEDDHQRGESAVYQTLECNATAVMLWLWKLYLRHSSRYETQLQREQRGLSVWFALLTHLKWVVSTLTNASFIWGVKTQFHPLNVGLDLTRHFCLQPTAHCMILESARKWVWRTGKSLGGFGKKRNAVDCVYQMRHLRTVISVHD